MPYVKFDIGSPLPDRVSYRMPFDIVIDQMKKRGLSIKTLSIITDIKEDRLEEVFNLPVEQLDIFVYDNDPSTAQNSQQMKNSTADEYYMRWYNENPYEASRFHGICHALIGKSFSDDATNRVQNIINQWLSIYLGISHQTLSMFIGVESSDIEAFLASPDSLPKDVKNRIITNTIRFNDQINRFITKTDPKITIPVDKNAPAFWN